MGAAARGARSAACQAKHMWMMASMYSKRTTVTTVAPYPNGGPLALTFSSMRYSFCRHEQKGTGKNRHVRR